MSLSSSSSSNKKSLGIIGALIAATAAAAAGAFLLHRSQKPAKRRQVSRICQQLFARWSELCELPLPSIDEMAKRIDTAVEEVCPPSCRTIVISQAVCRHRQCWLIDAFRRRVLLSLDAPTIRSIRRCSPSKACQSSASQCPTWWCSM